MDKPTIYQIRVKGHLDKTLGSWFEGFTITNQKDGDALLTGPIQDQAALHGILNRISNLGLTLISVNVVPKDEGNMREEVVTEKYVLAVFLILTPLISLAIPAFLSLPSEVVPLILVFIPAILAIIFTVFTKGRKGVRALLKKPFQWQVGFKWYVIAIGMAVGLRLTMSVLARLLGWIPAIRLNDWLPPQYVIIGAFTLIGAFLEELAWRGYVLPKMIAHHSALVSALIIGIPWGVVHLGLILPGMMNEGTSWVATILFLVGISVILTWFFVQTGYGIVIGMIYHFAQNYFVFLNGGISSAESLWLMTVVTLAFAVILIIIFGTGLQRSPSNEFAILDAR